MRERSADLPVATAPAGTGPDSAAEALMGAIAGLPEAGIVADEAGDAAVAPVARRKAGIGAWLATGWLALVVALALLAPVLPIDDYEQINPECVNRGPTAEHWLGCDGIGRDLLSRNIWGARASLFVGVGAIVFGFLVGGTVGLLAGYYRGRLDSVLTAAFDVLLAFPQLVLALTLVAVLANDPTVSTTRRLGVLVVTLGIVGVPIVARITRANTLAWSQREFVLAARAQGAKNGRIIVREVLPNVLPAMFSISLLGVAVAIVAEGGLSVLGLGVQLPTPSWGNIIAVGAENLERAPHVVWGASGFIFFTVLSLNYLGDVVRQRFDVRESLL
jgi:peptide/nickel transport system permease protein